jgi:hypothetical protein
MPGDFPDDVRSIDDKAGSMEELGSKANRPLAPDCGRSAPLSWRQWRQPDAQEINLVFALGARQPTGLAVNRISLPSRLMARRMRAEAAKRQV